MNGLNRVLAFVTAVVLSAVGAALVYASVVNLSGTLEYLQAWASYLEDGLDSTGRLLLAAGGGVLVLMGVLVFYLEVRRAPRTAVRLRKIPGAVGAIKVEALEQRVRHDVEAISDVEPANIQLVSRGSSVDINLDIITDPYAEPAGKTEEVSRIIRDAVEGRMGVRIHNLNVKVSHGAIHSAGGHHKGSADHQVAAPGEQPKDA